jgi:Ankyrin repeats (3 copies)
MPKELPEVTSTDHSKNVSEYSVEKEVDLHADAAVSPLEKAQILGCYSHYRIPRSTELEINPCLGTECTALIDAVFQNDKKLVSRLLKSGANPNGVTESILRCTPVEIAVSMGSLEMVRLLCQAGAELNSDRSQVLQRAAQRGDSEMITLLLDYRAKIDHIASQQDLDWLKPSSTALHEACSSFSRAAIQVLVLRGADIEQKDWAGKTVLDRALEMGADASDIVHSLRNNLVNEVIRRADW